MAQGDYLIQNQSFPSFRSDLNETLEAINTSNSGTSRPTSAVAGTVWLDTTSATTPTLKFFDGTDDISLATLDYTANTVNWLDSTVVFDIVGDTTPQLGGDLDVNGNSLVSTSNGNITFTPNGTGKVVISGLNYPTADGSADQVLKTDGSGNLSFTDVSGGTDWQSTIVTGTTLTAVAGNGYWINTTSNACTITLPSSASVGDTIEFSDYLRTWGTNAVTLNPNSLNFQGSSSPNPEYNTNGQSLRLVYSGATQGWIPTSDDDVTFETPQGYQIEYLLVGGGGGGGRTHGAGGGAGGYLTSTTSYIATGNVLTVTVGAGGAGATSSGGGSTGGNTTLTSAAITTLTANGGGGSGSEAAGAGLDGGSGGGGGGAGGGTGYAGGSGTIGQGNDGGVGYTGGGGGGGASAVGLNGIPNGLGDGGDGLVSSITGSSVTRAGGGGGSDPDDVAGIGGAGGAGGGGAGAGQQGNAIAGTANTGGGGGGSSNGNGGNGGSGVVILSMLDADYSGTTTGSPTVATGVSGKTILTFNASGSYTT